MNVSGVVVFVDHHYHKSYWLAIRECIGVIVLIISDFTELERLYKNRIDG